MARRIALLAALLASSLPAAADEPRLAEQYGFQAPEIYKLEDRINNLNLRDLDGDGTDDVAVVNNAQSRIDLLFSGGAGGEDPPAAGRPDEANYLPSDRRMRLASVPVDREVVSLRVGDLDGDGRPDLAFYGSPAELVVLPNTGKASFGEPRRVDVPEAVASQLALDIGDVTGDGKPDLVLLTAEDVVIVRQGERGQLAEPERLPHSASNPLMLKLVDFDGDQALDMLLIDGSGDEPLLVRFGTKGGPLGPEERMALETPRAVALADIDGRPGSELLTIENRSGRARNFTLGGEAAGSEARSARVRTYPLPRGGTRERSVALGDLEGDGKADVVATDPARSRVLVYPRGPAGPGTARPFASLAGLKAVRLGDLDGDKRAEVVVLSDAEKQIAWSRYEEGRLSFPTPLPVRKGEPVAVEVADLDGDGRAEVLYAVPGEPEKGGRVFVLRALRREPDGSFAAFRWGEAESIAVAGLNAAPPALRVVDADGDRRADILVFNEYGTPAVLRGRADGPPTPVGGGPGPLANADSARVTEPPPGQPGIIVAQGGFARHLVLEGEGTWSVKDQYNAGRGDAQVVAAAALGSGEGEDSAEFALFDRGDKALRYLRRADGMDQPAGRVSTGPLDLRRLHVADLDGDGREDLLLAGADRFVVVLNGRAGRKLERLAGYESDRKEAHLGDLAAGDINGDGRPDLVMVDTGEHFVEIAAYTREPAALKRALAFKVYERKAFRDPDRNVEPRDLALGDVDGDDLADLVLIVHDRVLIYRQDPGTEPEKTAGAK